MFYWENILACDRLEYMREWRRKNREKIRQYKKRYYHKHKTLNPRTSLSPEEKKQRMKEYMRSWYVKNKGKVSAYSKEYYQKNRAKKRETSRRSYLRHRKMRLARQKEKHAKNRQLVLLHYSKGEMKCSCCGCVDEWALSIDHIENDGANERKRLGKPSGNPFYRWLIAEHFPRGYQVLCRNCNWGKRVYGECPHRKN